MLYQSGHYQYEQGPIRPPSEQGSLFVLVQRNCAFDCSFCGLYRGNRFTSRSRDEIFADIATMRSIYDEIKEESFRQGAGGKIDKGVQRAIAGPYMNSLKIRKGDVLDGEMITAMFRPESIDDQLKCYLYIADWIEHGSSNVFLQDADALVSRTPDLLAVLSRLTSTFPSISRVSTYGTGTSTSRKSVQELVELRDAGLSRVHIGLESGSDTVLRYVNKDTDVAHLQEGGRQCH